ANRMNEVYADLNRKYFGDSVETDENISKEWSRIPHFYMNYYVYQYGTGYSAAQSLSHQILREGKHEVERSLDEFMRDRGYDNQTERKPDEERNINKILKTGNSDYPIEILKNAGVDMTTPEPIEQACQVFEQKLDAFEKLMKA